jgi:hypothetical protein
MMVLISVSEILCFVNVWIFAQAFKKGKIFEKHFTYWSRFSKELFVKTRFSEEIGTKRKLQFQHQVPILFLDWFHTIQIIIQTYPCLEFKVLINLEHFGYDSSSLWKSEASVKHGASQKPRVSPRVITTCVGWAEISTTSHIKDIKALQSV